MNDKDNLTLQGISNHVCSGKAHLATTVIEVAESLM